MANLSDKRIIYIQDNGVVAVICPADNCGLTIEEIQSRSVPAGKTSYIVDKSEVPTDRSFRNAWTYTP
tara:strand:- start:117 stop:320 length:204 start_codon:yes stop_codon:yes gene_type:complete